MRFDTAWRVETTYSQRLRLKSFDTACSARMTFGVSQGKRK